MWDVKKLKGFQLQAGEAPLDPLTNGSAPGPRWGSSENPSSHQTPVIGSRSASSP